ncbi:MAG TPA: PIN domain-containing protein [Chthonomonadaceae bacterium]|nr:PIN domain-containing protein [Chthonomonadaceae bacterium]
MINVVLDACVLYPPALRDLFMWLAVGVVYQPHWTEEIHAEGMRNVLADNPEITSAQLERTRKLMDAINEESLVTGYDKHLSSLTLPDPDDRHVLAAAIEAKASVIVTFNLSDFPTSALKPYNVRALHPDKYLTTLFDDAPELFLAAVKEHRASLKRPPKTADEYIETLTTNGLTKLAERLMSHRETF